VQSGSGIEKFASFVVQLSKSDIANKYGKIIRSVKVTLICFVYELLNKRLNSVLSKSEIYLEEVQDIKQKAPALLSESEGN
jgi:hypothetical protein